MKALPMVAAMTLALFGAVEVQAEQRTVRIYNWIEYMPPEILKGFEAETGIRPVYDVFDSPETLQSKLLTGNSGYDVAFPGSAMLATFIGAGTFDKLDRSKLPNWSRLDEGFMSELANSGDPGNQYAVPYMWGTNLIGYNVDKVREVLGPDAKLDSWDLIFKPENLSKLASCGVGFLDSPSDILPIALAYLGLDPNSEKAEDYRKAQDLMMTIRPYITYFNSSRYGYDLANGEICVAVGWSGGIELARKMGVAAGKGVKIDMFLPKEGAPLWSDVMVIPKGAQNVDEAHAFINYLLRPEVIAKASNAIGYPNPNKDATEFVIPEVRNNPNMYIPADRMSSLYALKALSLKAERIRVRTWNSIRTGK